MKLLKKQGLDQKKKQNIYRLITIMEMLKRWKRFNFFNEIADIIIKIIKMSLLTSPTHRQVRFRSVKYRLSRGTSYIEKTTEQKSKRNSSVNFPSSMCSSTKKIRVFSKLLPMNMTMNSQKANPELRTTDKSTYMETFHKLANMEKNRENAREKTGSQEVLERVQLPNLNEGNSYFTLLDNIHIPINYLKRQIRKLNLGLLEEVPKMQQIGSDMRVLKDKELEFLNETEKVGMQSFQILRKMLHGSKTMQQNFNLRIKRELRECHMYLPKYYNELEETKQRLIDMQKTIFSSQPFELAMKQERGNNDEGAGQGQLPKYF